MLLLKQHIKEMLLRTNKVRHATRSRHNLEILIINQGKANYLSVELPHFIISSTNLKWERYFWSTEKKHNMKIQPCQYIWYEWSQYRLLSAVRPTKIVEVNTRSKGFVIVTWLSGLNGIQLMVWFLFRIYWNRRVACPRPPFCPWALWSESIANKSQKNAKAIL